jgi:hypothetical protein
MADSPVIVLNDYVGQTRQRGRAREMQHRETQPFSDLIVGSPRILWEGLCTDEELDRIERQFIRDGKVRPRLNEKLNEDNPARIPKLEQARQRHERDARRGEQPWQWPSQRNRASLVEWESRTQPVPARVWTPAQIKAALWTGAWLLETIAVWAFLGQQHMLHGWARLGWSAAVAFALLVWSLAGAPITRRQWRKVRRRGWKRLSR